MYKLVVLFAFVTIVAGKPGYLHGAVEVAAPIVAKSYITPAAVSSTYREDIISKPSVAYAAAPAITYAAPVVAKAAIAEPVAVVAPVALSHSAREYGIIKPASVAYASSPAIVTAPVVQKTVSYAAPVAYTAPAAISSSYRTDVVSSPVVAKALIAPSVYAYGADYAHGAHASAVHAW